MTKRWLSLGGAACAAVTMSVLPLLADGASTPQNANLSGIWTLDVAASENPDGAERPSGCARPERAGEDNRNRGGVGVSGGDGGGGAMAGAGGDAGGSLGPTEMIRFCGMMNQFYMAPQTFLIQATDTDFMMMLDPETRFGYAHKTDNKGQALNTPAGPGEFKVKWDKEKVVREIETPDTLKIKEEYTLNAEGNLVVTLESSSRMVRVPNPKIKRVYVRQQGGGGAGS